MTKLLFLPGAGASAAFWAPVADQIFSDRNRHLFSWPGLGDEPPNANVRGVDDLVLMVVSKMDEPSDIIAQSMGGYIAMKAALSAPLRTRRMVLTATSGGLPVNRFGASEWRETYRRDFPRAARWITDVREDLSAQLSSIVAPTLLIWGDCDRISPVAVGERLRELIPNSELYIVVGGGHDLAQTHAAEIASIIRDHLV